MRLTSILLGAACTVTALARPVEDLPSARPTLSPEQMAEVKAMQIPTPEGRMPSQLIPAYNKQHIVRQSCIRNHLLLQAIHSKHQPTTRSKALTESLSSCNVPLEYYGYYLQNNFRSAATIIDRDLAPISTVHDSTQRKDSSAGRNAQRRTGRGHQGQYNNGEETMDIEARRQLERLLRGGNTLDDMYIN